MVPDEIDGREYLQRALNKDVVVPFSTTVLHR